MHGIAHEKFMLKNFSLPVHKMYLNTASLLPYGLADEKETFAACARACAQLAALAVQKHFNLGEGLTRLAQAARNIASSSTLRDSGGLEKRASTRPSRLSFKLSLRTPPRRKRPISHSHESCKVTIPVLGFGSARERESAKLRRERGG